MMTTPEEHISSKETVVRLLHQDWFVNGVLQQTAFELRNGETYLSVNRPAIETFDIDVAAFIESHPKFRTYSFSDTYRRAVLNVGEVRNVDISANGQKLDVSVEVEPRASHTKSHAGIFTRYEGKNIKGGQSVSLVTSDKKILSTLMIHQKLRWNLLQLAQIEMHPIG